MSITIDTFKGRPTTDFEKRNIRKTNYAYGMTMLTSLTSPTILWDYSPQQHLSNIVCDIWYGYSYQYDSLSHNLELRIYDLTTV